MVLNGREENRTRKWGKVTVFSRVVRGSPLERDGKEVAGLEASSDGGEQEVRSDRESGSSDGAAYRLLPELWLLLCVRRETLGGL